MSSLVITALAVLVQSAPADLPAGPGSGPRDGTRAAAPESIGSLLAQPAPGPEARGPLSSGSFFQMLGWVAALAVLALAAVRIWRRVASRGGTGLDGQGLRVVSRAALTPRHYIYAVRLGSQRLLIVGVSGDRIAALTEFDDPAQVLALDPTFQRTLEKAGSPDGGAAGPEAEDLSPYRREVQKLRELVRGWRGRLGRTAGAEARQR